MENKMYMLNMQILTSKVCPRTKRVDAHNNVSSPGRPKGNRIVIYDDVTRQIDLWARQNRLDTAFGLTDL